MKKLIIAAAALVISCAAYGQGVFTFNSHNTTAGNVLSFTLNGQPATGSDLFLQVSAGPDAAHQTALTPLLAINRTGAAAGFTSPFIQNYTVPGMTQGQNATVTYQAFQGTSLASATAFSTVLQASSPVALVEGTTPPNEVTLGTHTGIAIVPVPEPTTLALGLIGLGSLLAFRRRS